jgi:predicted adenylyl cyclase CyaB
MPQNLELKVSIESLPAAERVAKKLGARYAATLRQKDTYYNISSGRLKLREIQNDHAELIFYQRPNTKGGKYSEYTILPVENPKTMHQVLSSALGILVVVQKQRRLYLLENARLHFDRVKGLGTFLEFEVVLEHGKTQAQILFQRLCKAFSIQQADSLRYSYSDLLLKANKKKV